MNRNSDFDNYVTFSKKERLGVFCFIFLMLFICSFPYFFSSKPSHSLSEDPSLLAAIDTLKDRKIQSEQLRYEAKADQFEPLKTADFSNAELFVFDPNTISATDWNRLGLSDRTIKTILKYRSKGGKFFKKEDLKKIWGLPDGFYERVESFIRIELDTQDSHPNYANSISIDKKEKTFEAIDINKADTSAFISLPGIGSKLAARIVNFREKLGGFSSPDQVGEVYGLPDSTFQKIKGRLQVDADAIRKLNINTATKEELKTHPYIKWNLANAIVEYRNQHGKFTAVEELKKINIIDETIFKKIAPYFTIDQ